MKLALSLPLAIAACLGIGCSAPASVTGVFAGSDFSLRCDSPLWKKTGSGRDTVVVLSEHTAETLSTVNLLLTGVDALPLGEPIEVGSGAFGDPRPYITASVGDLVVQTRDDGVQILSDDNAIRQHSSGGKITLDENDESVSGSFQVGLDDGGFLEGVFAASPES